MTQSTRWPFVGRSEELSFIGDAMNNQAVPGLVLAGAAGAGKTRLLWEAVRSADSAKCLTRTVVATPATRSIPFGALAPLLPAELPTAATPVNVLRFAADALLDPDRERRVVLGVDDAHVLDDTSAAVLHQLALTGQAFVLASVRSGEDAPESVTALWKDEIVERLEVQGLSRGELAHLMGQVLDGDIDQSTLQRLWETTRGNMLYARELVNAGLDSGALANIEGVWRWDGDWVVAPRLAELLGRRMGRLEPDERHLMELVAFGAPIDVEPLTDLVGMAALQAVEEKNLIWVRPSAGREEVHLAHPLYGEVLRSNCPQLREMHRKQELADALESSGVRHEDDWLRIVTWRLDTGADVRPHALMTALTQARARFDLDLTIRLGQTAVGTGGGAAAVGILWRALLMAQRNTEVEALLSQWMLAPMTEADTADLIVGRASNLYWGMDQTERGFEVLHNAEASTQDPQSRDLYIAMRAFFHALGANGSAAIEAANGLLEKGTRNLRAEATARIAIAVIGSMTGRYEFDRFGLDELRSFIIPWENEPPYLAAVVDRARLHAMQYTGDLFAARTFAETVRAEAEQRGAGFSTYLHQVGLAQTMRLLGRPGTARRMLRQGLAQYRKVSYVAYQVPQFLFAELAHAEALCGNPEEARAALLEADQSARKSSAVMSVYTEQARPWVATVLGDRARAIAGALAVADALGQRGAKPTEMMLLHDVVRLGEAAKVADRLADLYEEFRSPLAGLIVRQAQGIARGDGADLEQVAFGYETIGAELFAAETFAQAVMSYEKQGLQASSRAARARAALVLDRCEGARTPAVEAIRAPDLTPRERDIAKLAASGLSSKDIADRLVVSKRTVDNHLHQVYTKLGITGREQLGPLFSAG